MARCLYLHCTMFSPRTPKCFTLESIIHPFTHTAYLLYIQYILQPMYFQQTGDYICHKIQCPGVVRVSNFSFNGSEGISRWLKMWTALNIKHFWPLIFRCPLEKLRQTININHQNKFLSGKKEGPSQSTDLDLTETGFSVETNKRKLMVLCKIRRICPLGEILLRINDITWLPIEFLSPKHFGSVWITPSVSLI